MSHFSQLDIDKQNRDMAMECISILQDFLAETIKRCIAIQETCREVRNALRNNGKPYKASRNRELTDDEQRQLDRMIDGQIKDNIYGSEVDGDPVQEHKRYKEAEDAGA